MDLQGYTELRPLHDGARTSILQARRVSDNQPVVLKQLRAPFPSAPALASLRREVDIANAVAGPGVVAMPKSMSFTSRVPGSIITFDGFTSR